MKHGGEALERHKARLKSAPSPLSEAASKQWLKELKAIASCDRCEFHANGQCRKQPPRVGTVKGVPVTLWPKVEPGDWCGEFSEWYEF